MEKSQNRGLKKGLLITFEGGEGAGKTTLIDHVFNALEKQNIPVEKTREPGGTPLGKKIRELLLYQKESPITKKAELLLFLADRAQHIEEKITPLLNEGKVVLCDRFTDSTRAYQGAGRSIDTQTLDLLCSFAASEVTPDLTFFLDLDPLIGLKRAKRRESHDRIEQETLSFHKRIRKAFVDFVKNDPSRFYRIDANESIETVCKQALDQVEKCLN